MVRPAPGTSVRVIVEVSDTGWNTELETFVRLKLSSSLFASLKELGEDILMESLGHGRVSQYRTSYSL